MPPPYPTIPIYVNLFERHYTSACEKDRMERILREFQIVIPDIQGAIAKLVADNVSELISAELR